LLENIGNRMVPTHDRVVSLWFFESEPLA